MLCNSWNEKKLKKSKKKDGLGFFCTIYINSLEGENGKKPSQHYTLIKKRIEQMTKVG